jgi:hypothetical protein
MSTFILKHLHPLIGMLGMSLSVSILNTQGVQIGMAMVVSMVVIFALFVGARWALWKSIYETWPNIRFDRQLSWGMGQLVCIPIIVLASILSDITLLSIIEAFLPSWFLMYACCKIGCQKYGCCRALTGSQKTTLPIFESIVSAILFVVTAINTLAGFNGNEVTLISITIFITLRTYSIHSRKMHMIVFKRHLTISHKAKSEQNDSLQLS